MADAFCLPDGCGCPCHSSPGMVHAFACCVPPLVPFGQRWGKRAALDALEVEARAAGMTVLRFPMRKRPLAGCPLSLCGMHVPRAEERGHPCACGWRPSRRILRLLGDQQRDFIRQTRSDRGLSLLHPVERQPELALQTAF